MSGPSKEERIDFWKHAYARASFIDARSFIGKILELGLTLQDPTRKALTIAALIAYCRPFKQRSVVRLTTEFVSDEYQELHDSAIEMRDKVVAHRDIDGPVADWGFISQLVITVDRGEVCIGTRSPIMTDDKARDMLPLLDLLITAMEAKAELFFEHHLNDLTPGNCTLNLDDESPHWISR